MSRSIWHDSLPAEASVYPPSTASIANPEGSQNILTFDIEDWYQSSLDILGPAHANLPRPVLPGKGVVKNTQRLLSILAEYDVSATCFGYSG